MLGPLLGNIYAIPVFGVRFRQGIPDFGVKPHEGQGLIACESRGLKHEAGLNTAVGLDSSESSMASVAPISARIGHRLSDPLELFALLYHSYP